MLLGLTGSFCSYRDCQVTRLGPCLCHFIYSPYSSLRGKGQHLQAAAMGPAHTSPACAPLLVKGSLLKTLFPCSVCPIMLLCLIGSSSGCSSSRGLVPSPAHPCWSPCSRCQHHCQRHPLCLRTLSPSSSFAERPPEATYSKVPGSQGQSRDRKKSMEPRTCVLSYVSVSALVEQEITSPTFPVPSLGSERDLRPLSSAGT